MVLIYLFPWVGLNIMPSATTTHHVTIVDPRFHIVRNWHSLEKRLQVQLFQVYKLHDLLDSPSRQINFFQVKVAHKKCVCSQASLMEDHALFPKWHPLESLSFSKSTASVFNSAQLEKSTH
jgi:hypothetical protein